MYDDLFSDSLAGTIGSPCWLRHSSVRLDMPSGPNIATMLCDSTPHGTIVSACPNLKRMVGLSADLVRGQSFRFVLDETTDPYTKDVVEYLFSSEKSGTVQTEFRKHGKPVVPCQLKVLPLRSSAGYLWGRAIIFEPGHAIPRMKTSEIKVSGAF